MFLQKAQAREEKCLRNTSWRIIQSFSRTARLSPTCQSSTQQVQLHSRSQSKAHAKSHRLQQLWPPQRWAVPPRSKPHQAKLYRQAAATIRNRPRSKKSSMWLIKFFPSFEIIPTSIWVSLALTLQIWMLNSNRCWKELSKLSITLRWPGLRTLSRQMIRAL